MGLLEAVMEFLLHRRVQSDLIGPFYLSWKTSNPISLQMIDFSSVHLGVELNLKKVACR